MAFGSQERKIGSRCMGTLGTKCFLLKPGLASRLCWTAQGCVMIRIEEKLPILSSHVGAKSPNSKTNIEQRPNQSRFELVHETIHSRDHHYPIHNELPWSASKHSPRWPLELCHRAVTLYNAESCSLLLRMNLPNLSAT